MTPRLSAVVLAVVVAAAPALADMRPSVISAFKGQLVVSKDELPEGKNDADTIKKIKSAQLHELAGEKRGEVTGWSFHYTAFLRQTGSSSLKVEFMNGNKLAANQSLNSINPKDTVLTGDLSIDEDEGLAKGKTYTVNLVNAKDQVVASTTLTMK